MPERLPPLPILGSQLRAPLKPLYTIVLCDVLRVSEAASQLGKLYYLLVIKHFLGMIEVVVPV